MGTVIDEAAARSFEAKVDDAVAEGAKLLVGNGREGALYSPTVLDHVRPEMDVVRTETFGPVSPVIRFRDIDDAIRIANGTAYGLSSAVCTNRLDYVTRFVSELHVGTVNIREVPGLSPRADAVRRASRIRTRLQGRRSGGDEELHQHQDVLAAVVRILPSPCLSPLARQGCRRAVQTLLNLLAGVSLLVWGTHIVRTGILRVYGGDLRRVLRHSVASAARAFFAGLGVTALIQSSTATALIVASFAGQG